MEPGSRNFNGEDRGAAEIPNLGTAHDVIPRGTTGSGTDMLRALAVAAGICCSVMFVVVGLRYKLQLFADGSMFSYAIAVQDAWAFHWHNISDRLFVYAFCHVPAEIYAKLTRDPGGGIAVYGFLFYGAQFLGIMATYAADRSKGRIIFSYACISTACLCPLVFGFPTEMWVAHALFWPALALCHYAGDGSRATALVFAVLLALALTHEGALILEAAILATLALRGVRDAAFVRAAGVFLAVLAIWVAVKMMLPPDDYDGPMMRRAALLVFDFAILTRPLLLLALGTVTSYGLAFMVARRLRAAATRHGGDPAFAAAICAGAVVATALAVYWPRFDDTLHADHRYDLRTVLLLGTAGLGAVAAAYALAADDRIHLPVPLLPRLMSAFASVPAPAIAGAILLVMLIHAVETAKFVRSWTDYADAVRDLAMGTASDPALGDAHFVSSERIGADLNRLSWFSTTPYLSVLVAPGFAPTRLVVDPTANYFWLSCATAMANEEADRAVPAASRRLVRVHACLHR